MIALGKKSPGTPPQTINLTYPSPNPNPTLDPLTGGFFPEEFFPDTYYDTNLLHQNTPH